MVRGAYAGFACDLRLAAFDRFVCLNRLDHRDFGDLDFTSGSKLSAATEER